MLRTLFILRWAPGWAHVAQSSWFQHCWALGVVTERRRTLRLGAQRDHKDVAGGQQKRLSVPRIPPHLPRSRLARRAGGAALPEDRPTCPEEHRMNGNHFQLNGSCAPAIPCSHPSWKGDNIAAGLNIFHLSYCLVEKSRV